MKGEKHLAQRIFERAEQAAAFIRERIAVKPRVAIVLGSGLGSFAERVEQAVRFPTLKFRISRDRRWRAIAAASSWALRPERPSQ